ncbi:MAG: nucleotidyltransferase family protein [Octadecabacter sp.]
MIPILILAAGTSSRMGDRDKLLEPVDRVPQLRRLAHAALTLGGSVFVALPSDDHPRANAIDDLDVTVLVVPEAAEGMGGTMRGAVAQLPTWDQFMMLLGDLVEIGADDMRKVAEAARAHPDAPIVRGATQGGKAGHPVVFHKNVRGGFANLAGDNGGEDLVRPFISQTILVALPENVARLDLDTPEDWASWRAETGR